MRVMYVFTGRTRMNSICVWNYPPRAYSLFLSWSTYKNPPMIVCPRSIQSYRSASDQCHFRVQRITADYNFMRGSAGDSIVWNFDNSGSSGLITSDLGVPPGYASIDAICQQSSEWHCKVAFYVTGWSNCRMSVSINDLLTCKWCCGMTASRCRWWCKVLTRPYKSESRVIYVCPLNRTTREYNQA